MLNIKNRAIHYQKTGQIVASRRTKIGKGGGSNHGFLEMIHVKKNTFNNKKYKKR